MPCVPWPRTGTEGPCGRQTQKWWKEQESFGEGGRKHADKGTRRELENKQKSYTDKHIRPVSLKRQPSWYEDDQAAVGGVAKGAATRRWGTGGMAVAMAESE